MRAHDLRGLSIAPERLHNTVAPVHDPRFAVEKNIERARRIAEGIRYPAFPVRFEWTGSFRNTSGSCPFVLQGDGGLRSLKTFRQILGDRMTRAGFKIGRTYTPHVTLLWAERCVEEYPIAPIDWTVHEFVLVLSLKGLRRHIYLARWSLH